MRKKWIEWRNKLSCTYTRFSETYLKDNKNTRMCVFLKDSFYRRRSIAQTLCWVLHKSNLIRSLISAQSSFIAADGVNKSELIGLPGSVSDLRTGQKTEFVSHAHISRWLSFFAWPVFRQAEEMKAVLRKLLQG